MDWRFLLSCLLVDFGGLVYQIPFFNYFYPLRWDNLALLNMSVYITLGFFIVGLALAVLGIVLKGVIKSDLAGLLALVSFFWAGYSGLQTFTATVGYGDNTAACGDALGRKWWNSDPVSPNRCDVWYATPNFAFLNTVWMVSILGGLVVLAGSLLALRRESMMPIQEESSESLAQAD